MTACPPVPVGWAPPTGGTRGGRCPPYGGQMVITPIDRLSASPRRWPSQAYRPATRRTTATTRTRPGQAGQVETSRRRPVGVGRPFAVAAGDPCSRRAGAIAAGPSPASARAGMSTSAVTRPAANSEWAVTDTSPNAVGARSTLIVAPSRSQCRGVANSSRSVSARPSSSMSQSCTSRPRSCWRKLALAALLGGRYICRPNRSSGTMLLALAVDERVARHPLGELAVEADQRPVRLVALQQQHGVADAVEVVDVPHVHPHATGRLHADHAHAQPAVGPHVPHDIGRRRRVVPEHTGAEQRLDDEVPVAAQARGGDRVRAPAPRRRWRSGRTAGPRCGRSILSMNARTSGGTRRRSWRGCSACSRSPMSSSTTRHVAQAAPAVGIGVVRADAGIDVGAILLPRQQARGLVAGIQDQVDLLLPERPRRLDQGSIAGDEVILGQEAELERRRRGTRCWAGGRRTAAGWSRARSAAWPQTTMRPQRVAGFVGVLAGILVAGAVVEVVAGDDRVGADDQRPPGVVDVRLRHFDVHADGHAGCASGARTGCAAGGKTRPPRPEAASTGLGEDCDARRPRHALAC